MSTRPAQDAAVIDVGSNSVRLVLYRLEGRAIWTVYNEKVLAGLGRDIARTRKLSPTGVEKALSALRRFRALIGRDDGPGLFAVATAAVRDAEDGPAFVEAVREATGFRLDVLSGADEARLSALGVAAGAPEADGVVADLGGASLELTPIAAGRPGKGETFPAGPFALGAPGPFDRTEVARTVAGRLERARAYAAPTLHAVGGAWRNLALIHMRMTGYPLEIIHQYRIPGPDAQNLAAFVARQSRSSLERMGGASKKRAETLPYAAVVLSDLIARLGVEEVIVSAYGLREGVLFDAMDEEFCAQNPLVAGAAALGGRREEAETLGAAIEAWLAPAFSALPPVFDGRDATLLAAASRLAELGARLHPDHRGLLAFEQVLRAPIGGQNHRERAFLATATYFRHTGVGDPPEPHTLSRLLDFQAERRARAMGAAVRLACDLSGRNPALLGAARLEIDEETVILRAPSESADLLLGEQTRRRAKTLATALGRRLDVRTI